MKVRELILDFTSLLDIILIILFFFIIFSSIESNEAQKKAKSAEKEAISIYETAENKMKEAEKIKKAALEELNTIKEEKYNQLSHIEGLNEFSRSENINFFLEISEEADYYDIIICQSNFELKRIHERIPDRDQNKDKTFIKLNERKIGETISIALDENGFSNDRTIICNFIYNSNNCGTNSVYTIVYNAFDNYVKHKYNNLYISYIDERKIKND